MNNKWYSVRGTQDVCKDHNSRELTTVFSANRLLIELEKINLTVFKLIRRTVYCHTDVDSVKMLSCSI